uniref:Thyroglobulin type-1 domain-containing protein n=1 Tax=Poecilia mexicana TaxID=48701 RepID=A0A3B3XBG4_9TELE
MFERPKTHCERYRDSIQTSSDGLPPPGIYIPQCDENGLYLSQQCHGSTGYCWCVNSSGQERIGTRTGPGSLRNLIISHLTKCINCCVLTLA